MENKINLVLSGGGSRCFAQIGVLKALEENNIKIDAISGTSGGALIAYLWGKGYSSNEIFSILKRYSLKDLIKLSLKPPFLNGSLNKIKKDFKNLKIQKERISFVCITNFITGQPEYFNALNNLDMVIASASIAGLFPPVKKHNNIYLDGGYTDNLPYKPFEFSNLKTIGINVTPTRITKKLLKKEKYFRAGLMICSVSNTKKAREQIDYMFDIEEVFKFSVFDFKNQEKIFKIGYNFMIENLKGLF